MRSQLSRALLRKLQLQRLRRLARSGRPAQKEIVLSQVTVQAVSAPPVEQLLMDDYFEYIKVVKDDDDNFLIVNIIKSKQPVLQSHVTRLSSAEANMLLSFLAGHLFPVLPSVALPAGPSSGHHGVPRGYGSDADDGGADPF